MALTVNTNIASLTAQRNLTGSQQGLSESLQRLSSGLRINSAKDDAAGLAISERFSAQIRGLNQGVRNANDAISLAQTAEGALKEVTANLQRIRELSVQSANATNSLSDREALQAEVAQLVAEIDRVAVNTKFNGSALLDGSFANKAFQVGADVGETVTVEQITSARTAALGATYSSTGTGANAVDANAFAAADFYINNVAIGASTADGVSSANSDSSALSKANAINALTSQTGVSATASTTLIATNAITAGVNAAAESVAINDVVVSWTNGATLAATQVNLLEAINAKTSETGVTGAIDAATGKLSLTAADGRNINIGADISTTAYGVSGFTSQSATGKLSLTSSSTNGIQITDAAVASLASAGGSAAAQPGAATLALTGTITNVVPASASAGGLDQTDISSVSGATAAITAVDAALVTVNATRATLGSYQNRFESVVSSAQTTSENLSASRSRIMDADFAAETASLTKNQILQQSGIAMLAQANSIPQNVLALLQ